MRRKASRHWRDPPNAQDRMSWAGCDLASAGCAEPSRLGKRTPRSSAAMMARASANVPNSRLSQRAVHGSILRQAQDFTTNGMKTPRKRACRWRTAATIGRVGKRQSRRSFATCRSWFDRLTTNGGNTSQRAVHGSTLRQAQGHHERYENPTQACVPVAHCSDDRARPRMSQTAAFRNVPFMVRPFVRLRFATNGGNTSQRAVHGSTRSPRTV